MRVKTASGKQQTMMQAQTSRRTGSSQRRLSTLRMLLHRCIMRKEAHIFRSWDPLSRAQVTAR